MDKVKPRKSKLDKTVLEKSKRFVKQDEEGPEGVSRKRKLEGSAVDHVPVEDNEDVPCGDMPLTKMRKPRHASVEGQRFLKAKERVHQREWKGSSLIPATTAVIRKEKSLKGRKKKKGKKKIQAPQQDKNNRQENEKYKREAVAYLQLWKEHRNVWKFEKLKQIWLLKHALEEDAVDDKVFDILLQYLSSIKGVGKDKTRKEMEEFMERFEKRFGPEGETQLGSKQKPEEKEIKEYDRARMIVQMLTE